MGLSANNLKKAAAAARTDTASRIANLQGGVPTFFDNFLNGVVTRLQSTEAIHHWKVNHQALPGTDTALMMAELRWLAGHLENCRQGRFVPYDVRRSSDGAAGRDSEIGDLELLMSQGTASPLTWKGSPLFKTAFDFAMLPMLLWELKPGSVFEIGSGTGASARWIADTLRSLDLQGEVYSADINPVQESYPGVRFFGGDSRSPETLFDADLLRSAPRPCLVVEDAHVNVHGVLTYIDGFLSKGDYLFVEDSRGKHDDLARFLSKRANHYRVDSRYTDFFGRNATCAPNSIFVRV